MKKWLGTTWIEEDTNNYNYPTIKQINDFIGIMPLKQYKKLKKEKTCK